MLAPHPGVTRGRGRLLNVRRRGSGKMGTHSTRVHNVTVTTLRADTPLLEARGLKVYFPVKAGIIRDRVIAWVKALDGVDLVLNPGKVVGVVGESGSGKTTLGKTFLLLERPTDGEVFFEDRTLASLRGADLKAYRLKVQAVFQDPFASLSPRMRIQEIVGEPLQVAGRMNRREVQSRVFESMKVVGLDPSLLRVFPHELSGGQRQRVAIARAISTESRVVILDEPTSALDVSVRLQIVHLLMELQKRLGLTYLLIGHDLAVVAYMSDEIAVMYLGKIIESGPTAEVLERTAHPYTQALISASLPSHPREKREREIIVGEIGKTLDVPPGCRFHPRCKYRVAICSEREPPLRASGENGHRVACHLEVLANVL
jgi:oligopeptide/dipeptide ABC transporter ATP-binding protein